MTLELWIVVFIVILVMLLLAWLICTEDKVEVKTVHYAISGHAFCGAYIHSGMRHTTLREKVKCRKCLAALKKAYEKRT